MKEKLKIVVLVACFLVALFIGLLSIYFVIRFVAERGPIGFLTEKESPQAPEAPALPTLPSQTIGDFIPSILPPPGDKPVAVISTLSTPQVLKVAIARKLIREAELTLHVQDVTKTIGQIEEMTKQLGGYVADISQSRESDGKWSAELTLRIPLERYSEALSQLRQLGQVENFRDNVQDVTEEFIDLEARLRNLKRSEQHLLELLRRTSKVTELLQVERELSKRRSEIESLEGRLRYLTHQTTFSKIRVNLIEFRPHPMPRTAFSVPKVFADAFRTTVLILRGILVVMIWVIVLGIIWIPLSVFGLWFSQRALQAKKQSSLNKPEERQ
ncbi:MAG: DUF4349 domain-containing protein [Armatimonadota bacterium]|nr:DUF4349 domain-containing protein [Armatimonadota bacterium]MDW8026454.1 DUF4349 domain-containing protein [Armatimonadota bacterium]